MDARAVRRRVAKVRYDLADPGKPMPIHYRDKSFLTAVAAQLCLLAILPALAREPATARIAAPATVERTSPQRAAAAQTRGNPMQKLVVDHVLVGIADLEAGIRLLAGSTGVAPARGGQHPGRGTQNALLSLGPHTYLELIAPVTGTPTKMEFLAGLRQPTPVGWAVGTGDLDATVRRLHAAGWRVAAPRAGSRVRPDGQVLHWRTAELQDMPADLTPFLIEWSAGTPHPATTSPPGCTLESLEIRHPQADRLAALVKELGVAAVVQPGAAPRLNLTLRCPAGRVTLPAP
jgi:hypothetical protein